MRRLYIGARSSWSASPYACATLTRTARDAFAVPASIRRTYAGSTPILSAAASTVQPRAARKSRARKPKATTTRR